MLSGTPEGTLLQVRVIPGARKSEIVGEAGGRLRIRLQAPPVEGKANRELTRFIARELGLKKNRVTLSARREITREKSVLLGGLSACRSPRQVKFPPAGGIISSGPPSAADRLPGPCLKTRNQVLPMPADVSKQQIEKLEAIREKLQRDLERLRG